MQNILSRFESIGDNCEFGFVQRHHQYEEGGLLRWALVVDSSAIIKGIPTRFAGMFAFENLAPAGGGTMVLDTLSQIAFHTHLTSQEKDGALVFDKPENERREIHADEAIKLTYLSDKFFATLAEGQKILVFKQNSIVPPDVAHAILRAVSVFGNCSLLYVDPVCSGEVPGTVERIAHRLYRGMIDRFAPYDKANEISIDVWSTLCRNTLELHSRA